jgi:hypothetical protein
MSGVAAGIDPCRDARRPTGVVRGIAEPSADGQSFRLGKTDVHGVSAMRLSIPPLFPPYSLLVLVIVYAFGALWLGLARLDDLARLSVSTTGSIATLDDLQALRDAVGDVEAAGPAAAASADARVASLERGRGRIPALLAGLRDKMRDDPAELAFLEELVPKIAERTTLAVASIDRTRSAADAGKDVPVDRAAKAASEGILTIIEALRARELDELGQGREARNRATAGARRDLYMMAGVTLLLAGALFLALRRLRSFIVVTPVDGDNAVAGGVLDSTSAGRDAGVGTLLRDALLRLRLAPTDTPVDPDAGEHRRSLQAAVEQALAVHAAAYGDDPLQPVRQGLAAAMATLAQAYTRADSLAIEAQLDQRVTMQEAQTTFLVFRSAEWALEAIAVRKRAGRVTLELSTSQDRVFLRVHALVDDPRLPLALTRKESEEAEALRQGATAIGGSFIVGEGPTGFSLMLTVPADS